MNRERHTPTPLIIPKIKADSETQTLGQVVSFSPTKTNLEDNMEAQNIRKRRTLSKNRGQTRQREKTPEPGRTPIPHEDTTTSDDEDFRPQRSSREIEADKAHDEMRRLVQEKSSVKDPVYDLDTNEVLEARAMEACARRRRSVSPFAVPDKEELSGLQRKGSFIDPGNKLLSTTYTLSPKDEDTGRRGSLVIDTPKERKNSLTLLTPPANLSPKLLQEFPFSIPTTPKKLDEMVYEDEKRDAEERAKTVSPLKKEGVFTFEEEPKPRPIKLSTPKPPETPTLGPGELVTKVIQIERTPSKKLTDEMRPTVEVRQRIVRTPSRKSEVKPTIVKQINKEEPVSKLPPVKPARSRSASRFGGKTSESEMSEDQGKALMADGVVAPKRRVVPTPRRFIRNKSPRGNRSQSVNRVEEIKQTSVPDKAATGISQTSKEILELMEKARARSLSIPKDDPRVPAAYKKPERTLATPNKTPTTLRQTRGISCPKTIQIISDKEILGSFATKQKVDKRMEKASSRSSGYIDASQSEYTSSCYSSSPSDNEYIFDLAEKTAELTEKLHKLSQKVEEHEKISSIIMSHQDHVKKEPELKSVLRKRKTSETVEAANGKPEIKKETKPVEDKKKTVRSRWKFIANWQQFREEHTKEWNTMMLQKNRCICDSLLLIFFCGLGGMMFRYFEGSFENAFKCSTRNVKRDFIETLWRGSHYMREEEWKSMARKKMFEFEEQLHIAHENGVTSYSGLRSWNFMNSFVYCLTLVTTIGYGHIAPKTTSGRVATIVYAIIGIPLFLIVLADFGKLFTRIIKFFWAFIRRFYYTRSCKKVRRTVPMQEMMKGFNIMYDAVRRPSQVFNPDDIAEAEARDQDGPPPLPPKPSNAPPPLFPRGGVVEDTEPETPAPSVFEIDDEFNLPISVAIFILIGYMVVGASVYNAWESWNFFESFYFVFISMSTIGLGDLVPDHPIFMMSSILYLVFGLALTSMCINVVQVKLSDTFKQASAKIGATIGLRVAEEDGSLVPTTPPTTEVAPVHMPKKQEVENESVDSNDVELKET